MTTWFYRGPSIDVLHEDYARCGRIDERAPVQAREQTWIAAPVARVWALLSDPTGWPAIDPAITDVQLDQPLAAGSRFVWTNGKTRIRSRVAVLRAGREITWTGSASGARAVHRYELAPGPNDATLLRSDESMAGPLLALFFSSVKAGRALASWLLALKTAAARS